MITLTREKMNEYIIVREILIQNFIALVNQKIAQGYTPLGGVTTKNLDGTEYYMQAMAKLDYKV